LYRLLSATIVVCNDFWLGLVMLSILWTCQFNDTVSVIPRGTFEYRPKKQKIL